MIQRARLVGRATLVKRFVLLTLLFVLPLQTLWAAGAGHCLAGGGVVDHASGQREHGHEHGTPGHVHDHAGPSVDAGQTYGSAIDCNAFHFVALDGSGMQQDISAAAAGAPFDPLNTFFKSHIPPGPDRPRWRFVF